MKLLNLILVVLLCMLQYRLWFGDGNILEVRRLQLRRNDLLVETNKLRERNRELEADVQDLKEGLDAVEERARQDLGMIKTGEIFIQVIDADTKKQPPPPPTREDRLERERKAPATGKPANQADLPSED